jgi:hypothetical protein
MEARPQMLLLQPTVSTVLAAPSALFLLLGQRLPLDGNGASNWELCWPSLEAPFKEVPLPWRKWPNSTMSCKQ